MGTLMTSAGKVFDNRVTRLLGVDIPILQAPMGHIAKPELVARDGRGRCGGRGYPDLSDMMKRAPTFTGSGS